MDWVSNTFVMVINQTGVIGLKSGINFLLFSELKVKTSAKNNKKRWNKEYHND